MGPRVERWWGHFCLWRMDRCDRQAQQALKAEDAGAARALRGRAVRWGRRALHAGQDPLSPAARRAKLGVDIGENNG